MRVVLALYVVFGLVAGIGLLTFGPSAPFDSSASSPALERLSTDPAGSTSRFNSGAAEQEPSWSADDFLDAVEGHSGGQIVRMPGAQTYLDDAAVTAVTANSNLLVVVTPPTPLGAVEKTRIRDNTVQKSWATKRDLTLIMVHGQAAYRPPPHLIIRTTPPGGVSMREGMRTADMTSSVIYVATQSIQYANDDDKPRDYPPDTGATTSKALALTDTRPPTGAELDPITKELDSGDLYVDPSIKHKPKYNKDWGDIAPGKKLKLVIFPFAKPGLAIDYTAALKAKYPHAAILVMTGKWIESAGIDRQTMIDAMIQTYGLGGFALAEAPQQQYAKVLDWVTGIDASATESHAFARPLPVLPGSGFPRWAAYLLLATSLVVALGFAGEYLASRRSPATALNSKHWQDRLASGLAASYFDLSSAPHLGKDGSLDKPAAVQHLLDSAYADLLTLRGIDVDKNGKQAGHLADTIWGALDNAAAKLERPEAGPTQTMPATLREVPDEAAAKKDQARRQKVRNQVTGWLIIAGIVVGCYGGFLLLGKVREANTNTHADISVAPLATSSIMTVGTGDADVKILRHIVGDRGMLVAISDKSAEYNSDLAYNMAKNYPDAAVFVINDGEVDSAEIGSGAQEGDYDKYALIEDYYGLQNSQAGNTALVRQLALLYDRLDADGSIDNVDRTAYDPPSPPWGWIAAGLVVSLAAAAQIVRTATRQAVAQQRARNEELAAREGLTTRLAGISPLLLNADANDASGPDAEQLACLSIEYSALLQRVDSADPVDFDALRDDIDAFSNSARATVSTANDR